MLGLSCVISSDVNALKYQVTKIPIMYPSSDGRFSPNPPTDTSAFTVSVSPDYYPSEHLYDNSQLSQYVLSLDGDSNGCSATAFKHYPLVISATPYNTLSYSFGGWSPSDSWVSRASNLQPCASSHPPEINRSSVHSLTVDPGVKFHLTELLPYRYSYDGFYVRDAYSSDGLNFDTKFDLVYNLFGKSDNVPDRIYRVQIPFGAPDFEIPKDTPISASGEFILDFEDPSVDVLSSETSLKFGIHIMQSPLISGMSYEKQVICDYSLARDNPADPLSVFSLKYSCDGLIVGDSGSNIYTPGDIVIPYLIVDFKYNSDTTNPMNMMIFDSFFTITDNDDTPASTPWSSSPIEGSSPHSAPGSAYQNAISGQDPDYDTSLTGMFSFGFLNPFAPIFNLFSDQNSCAQIPTIAGMIHSNETQVCPWFDSNTRNIVTPVLGLSSMMLIFGFAVRWLGGGSGNMFIDDDIKDTGSSFSLRNKFGRNK